LSKVYFVANTNHKKGKAFEQLITLILESEGYTKIYTNIYKTGTEIDVKAKHKVKNEVIICECKATERVIESNELLKFYAKLKKEMSLMRCHSGLFFSIAGYTGSSYEWYSELPKKEKNTFKLYESDDILQLLIKNNLLLRDSEINKKLLNYTNLDLGKKLFVIFESSIYIIQLLKRNGKEDCFLIISSQGDLVNFIITTELIKNFRILDGLTYLNPHIYRKTIHNLLDSKPKTQDEICNQIVEDKKTIDVIFSQLSNEQLIDVKNDLLLLRKNKETFTKVFQLFFNTETIFDFMNSDYFTSSLRDIIENILINDYKLKLEDIYFNELFKACHIFPSVIHHILLSDKSFYQNAFKEQQRVKNASNIDKMILSVLFQQLTTKIINDLNELPEEYLTSKGVEGIHIKAKIILASEFEMILNSYSETTRMILPKGNEAMDAGTLLQPSSLGLLLNTAHVFASLTLYDQSLRELDVIIQNSKEAELLAAAYNSKGLVLSSQGHTDEASDCFNNALKYSPNNPTIINNLKKYTRH
jgi:tetratricopeptide (TPR) repeat protein